jgi:hypothetical protein
VSVGVVVWVVVPPLNVVVGVGVSVAAGGVCVGGTGVSVSTAVGVEVARGVDVATRVGIEVGEGAAAEPPSSPLQPVRIEAARNRKSGIRRVMTAPPCGPLHGVA